MELGIGMIAIAASIAVLVGISQGFGNAFIVSKALEMIGRNPEANSKIRSTMIIGIALTETTAIYALIVAILLIFVLPGNL